MGSLSLLQRIFPTQESNQGLLHCRRILYQLSCQGSLLLQRYLYLISIGYSLHRLKVQLCFDSFICCHLFVFPLLQGFCHMSSLLLIPSHFELSSSLYFILLYLCPSPYKFLYAILVQFSKGVGQKAFALCAMVKERIQCRLFFRLTKNISFSPTHTCGIFIYFLMHRNFF